MNIKVDVIRSLIKEKNNDELTRLLNKSLGEEKKDPEVLNALGVAAIMLKRPKDAKHCFKNAARKAPGVTKYLKNFVKLIHDERDFVYHMDLFKGSGETLEDAEYSVSLFLNYVRYGMSEEAVKLGLRLLSKHKSDEKFCLMLVKEAQAIGRMELADEIFSYFEYGEIQDWEFQYLKLKSDQGVSSDQVDLLWAEGSSDQGKETKEVLIADKLWGEGQFKDSLGKYKKVYSLTAETRATSWQIEFKSLRSVIMLDTAELSTFPDPGIIPIFVIGMPRCGSTLLHQMLSSHDDIGGVGELGILHRELGTWLLDCRDNDKLEKIRLLYLREVEHFLKKTGQVNRKYFVDKSLSNFRYVGLLERLFPSAKFILMTRERLDHKISIYRQNFQIGQHNYSFSDKAINCAFELYECYLQHWKTAGANIHTQNLEKLVADPIGEAQRVMDFIGMPAGLMLDNTQSKVPVRTASVLTASQKIVPIRVPKNLHAIQDLCDLNFTSSDKAAPKVNSLLSHTDYSWTTFSELLEDLKHNDLYSELVIFLGSEMRAEPEFYLAHPPLSAEAYLNSGRLNHCIRILIDHDLNRQAVVLGLDYADKLQNPLKNTAILNNLSLAMIRTNRCKEAVELANTVLSYDGGNKIARINRINAYIMNEQHQDILGMLRNSF